LFAYIFLSQMSSVPLNSTSFIIGFGQVTGGEFLYIQYIVSCINSVKCCLLGQQIRVATQPGTVILLSNIIVAITVIPTLLTVGLSYFTLHVYRTQLQCSLHTTTQGQLPLKAERAEHARDAEEDVRDCAADQTAPERSTSRRGQIMSFCLDFSQHQQHQYDAIEEPTCHAMPAIPLIAATGAQASLSAPPSPSLSSVQAPPLPEHKNDVTEVQQHHRGTHTSELICTHSCEHATDPLLPQLADASVQQSPSKDLHQHHTGPIAVGAIICAPVQIAKMIELASLALACPSVSVSAMPGTMSRMAPEADEHTDCLDCCELSSSHTPQNTRRVKY
jgi:hypothetical protein